MADRNELNIPLIDGFRLRADEHQWIVEEEVGKEGKKVWRVKGYYQSLGVAMNDLFVTTLRRYPTKDIAELVKEAERASNALVLACSAIDSWGIKSENAKKVF